MNTPIKAIRKKCLECCGHQYSEIRHCELEDCPLYEYRMGKRPSKDKVKSQGLVVEQTICN